jgi:hypothetical protein
MAGACICGRCMVVDTQRLMMQAHAGIGSVSSPAALERAKNETFVSHHNTSSFFSDQATASAYVRRAVLPLYDNFQYSRTSANLHNSGFLDFDSEMLESSSRSSTMAADMGLRLSVMRGTVLLEAEGRPCAHDVSDREQHQGLLDRKRHGVVRSPCVLCLCWTSLPCHAHIANFM